MSPLGFKARVGSLIRAVWRHTCHMFPEILSGATPGNLLAASMAAEPSLPHTYEALMGLKTRSYHAATHSVRSGRRSTD